MTAQATTATTPRSTKQMERNRTIRQWAQRKGLTVAVHGPIRRDVVEQYDREEAVRNRAVKTAPAAKKAAKKAVKTTAAPTAATSKPSVKAAAAKAVKSTKVAAKKVAAKATKAAPATPAKASTKAKANTSKRK